MTPCDPSRESCCFPWVVSRHRVACGAQPTIAVNTTVDSVDVSPGNGVCVDGAGLCSLRAAIMEANANASVGTDIIELPAGVYTLTPGPLAITASMTIRGAGSTTTIIDADHRNGVLSVGSILYSQTRTQGTVDGMPFPIALATSTDSFVNCPRAEVSRKARQRRRWRHRTQHPPITFDFPLTAAEVAAVTGTDGRGVLTVTASRDIGHKIGNLPDIVPATVDGVGVGDLFRRRHRHVPGGENFAPIDFFCGPNFHNDFPGTDSVFVNQGTFQTGAANGTIRVVLSPVGGAGNSGVGRFKVFSVRLLHERDVGHTEWADAPQWKRKRHCQQRWLRAGIRCCRSQQHRLLTGAAAFPTISTVTLRDCTILGTTAVRAPVGGQHGSRARRTGALHDQRQPRRSRRRHPQQRATPDSEQHRHR